MFLKKKRESPHLKYEMKPKNVATFIFIPINVFLQIPVFFHLQIKLQTSKKFE